MPRQITCPGCGETEQVNGQSTPEGIELTCQTCATAWMRDSAHTRVCATCGGHDLVERPQALTQYSRGNQVSITGWSKALLCRDCDAAMLARSLEGKPVPYHYRSAAAARRDPDPGDGGTDGQMLPKL